MSHLNRQITTLFVTFVFVLLTAVAY